VARAAPCGARLREHLLAQLVCPGRHTVTALLTTNGRQFVDWTADYALYAQARIQPDVLFHEARREIDALRDRTQPLVVALDDTVLRKTGRRIPGAAYRKDPLGPKFHLNLVWAQRRLQFAAARPGPAGAARMIPIAYADASTPRKPRRHAPEATWQQYREELRQANLNRRAVDGLHALQAQRHREAGGPVPLHLVVDGSFTNRVVARNLPDATTLIGRIRKDAHLSFRPTAQPPHGRKRLYGPDAPTPEQLRQDPGVPWQRLRVYFAGKRRTLRVKTLAPLRWRVTGARDLRLVVIAPVPYALRLGGRRYYRQPVYLICTAPDLELPRLVQEYLWRWDIEVNHRDEKTLLGVGQAQVRNPNSAVTIPATAVASYALLQVAAVRAFGWQAFPGHLPWPKWRHPKKKNRASTLDLINELRRELWAAAIHAPHLTDFASGSSPDKKSEKRYPSLPDALLYATA